MSEIHHKRIKSYLESELNENIELSHIAKFDEAHKEKARFSQSQMCLALNYLTGLENEKSLDSLTDCFGDNGIDSIYPDTINKILYVSQSKWVENGIKAPKKTEIQTFLHGVDDLINNKYQNFNEKVRAKKEVVIKCLLDPKYKIRLILVYTGTQPLGSQSINLLDEYVERLNDDVDDTFAYEVLSQKELYKAILSGLERSPINLDQVTLFHWGKHEHPYEAVYGEIEAEYIAKIWKRYGKSMLTKNLRNYKGNTNINSSIQVTLSNSPSLFWYYNNGITVLCNGINKSAIHGNSRTAGVFEFEDISVVNGAQTLGSIGEAFKGFPNEVKNARVQIRFINLKDAPEEISKEITRYTNTQNRIENKDFAALDQNQERLKHELLLDKKYYVYRTGEQIMKEAEGCTIEEATFSLACSKPDINLSVIAHRNIGSIWEDIEKPPYTIIFNDRLKSTELWNAVMVNRMVKRITTNLVFEHAETHFLVITHGDSLILHKVFEYLGRERLKIEKTSIKESEIKATLEKVLNSLFTSVDLHFKSLHPITLFKNKVKIEKLSRSMDQINGFTHDLFS